MRGHCQPQPQAWAQPRGLSGSERFCPPLGMGPAPQDARVEPGFPIFPPRPTRSLMCEHTPSTRMRHPRHTPYAVHTHAPSTKTCRLYTHTHTHHPCCTHVPAALALCVLGRVPRPRARGERPSRGSRPWCSLRRVGRRHKCGSVLSPTGAARAGEQRPCVCRDRRVSEPGPASLPPPGRPANAGPVDRARSEGPHPAPPGGAAGHPGAPRPGLCRCGPKVS